jgi:glycosyltransferase involved in cell wall biosynthesis
VRVEAEVLLTTMDTDEPIYRFCAGASNKRFEAMAAGVAQVTNQGPGIDRLFVDTGAAVAAPHHDPEAIGEAIGSLLNDRDRRTGMGRTARALHLEKYHYEAEFAPVMDEIRSRLQTAARG